MVDTRNIERIRAIEFQNEFGQFRGEVAERRLGIDLGHYGVVALTIDTCENPRTLHWGEKHNHKYEYYIDYMKLLGTELNPATDMSVDNQFASRDEAEWVTGRLVDHFDDWLGTPPVIAGYFVPIQNQPDVYDRELDHVGLHILVCDPVNKESSHEIAFSLDGLMPIVAIG